MIPISPSSSSPSQARCERNSEVHPFHDGELPEEKRISLEGHLPVCASCAHELETLRRMSQWIGAGNTRPAAQLNPRIAELRSVQSAYRLELGLIGMAATIMLICSGTLLSFSVTDNSKVISLEPIVLSNDSRLAESDPLLQAMIKEYGR